MVEWNDGLIHEIRGAVMRGIVRATEGVKDEGTSLILDTPKTGRIYRRRGITHQASAPGEPPASDTGRLVQSARTLYDTTALTGIVNWSTEYAGFLEFGTSRMAPRPYARPALANCEGQIVDDVAQEIQQVL